MFPFRCGRKDPPRLPGESSQVRWPRDEVGWWRYPWPGSLTITPQAARIAELLPLKTFWSAVA
jgi:hypothetical protein